MPNERLAAVKKAEIKKAALKIQNGFGNKRFALFRWPQRLLPVGLFRLL